ncbi:MAG TPA: TetR/AcrR family transcriptional regulator [Holophagaceae bacterium]|nr:TetR/AcrR family transcriptional regulator [Holophagaceae bacterium]
MSTPRKPLPTDRSRGPKPSRIEPDRILDAAEVIFSHEGMKGASLRAIAHEAGCDPALLYYHFENKEAIFTALLDRCMPAMTEDLQRLADPADLRPMPLRIWDVLQVYRRHMGHHVGLRNVVRGEMVRGAEGVHHHLAERVKRNSILLWEILQQGVDRGELRPDLHVKLAGFFLVKTYMEILDVLPNMAPRVAGIPADEVVPLAERAWFELYWRGVAVDPLRPIPELPSIP